MSIIKKKLTDLLENTSDGIPLDKFIEICLFSKDGYYKTCQPIGEKADFTTAPEISQLFGEILGLYIYNLWNKHLDSHFNLIELGPGKGTLISDILRINKPFESFRDSVSVNLIEIKNIEKQIYEKVKSTNPKIIENINNTGELDEEAEKKLSSLMEEFKKDKNK